MQTTYYAPSRRRSIAYQNGTAQNRPQQSSSSDLEKLLQANTTVTVWLIFLAIGGGLLARYYLRIGYLPDMEWNAALVYLFVCTVWGGVVGLLLTISLYLPGVIWCDIIIYEPVLEKYLSYPAEHDEPSGRRSKHKEPCIKSIVLYLATPFFVALLLSHLLLRTSDMSAQKRIDLYWVFAAVILAATFLWMRWFWRRRLISDDTPEEDKDLLSRQIVKYSIWFTLSVLLNQISMYVIYRLADRTPDNKDFLILTVLCTIGVSISTLVVAVRHHYFPRQALVAALVTAVVLLFMADRFSDLSMKLMSRYGIGEDKKFNLLVKKEVIELLSSDGVKPCGPQHLCDVQILSRMGDHYFVRVGGKNITVPKTDVIAIRRLESVESAKN